MWDCELGSLGSGYGPVVGSCEHGNGTSGYVKEGEFLDWLSNCQVFKDSAPCSYLVSAGEDTLDGGTVTQTYKITEQFKLFVNY
jgi:hypothetical protein